MGAVFEDYPVEVRFGGFEELLDAGCKVQTLGIVRLGGWCVCGGGFVGLEMRVERGCHGGR